MNTLQISAVFYPCELAMITKAERRYSLKEDFAYFNISWTLNRMNLDGLQTIWAMTSKHVKSSTRNVRRPWS